MTKRERVQAALARQPVDRPPVAFWRHVPELDHDPRRLAEAMLTFHQRWDLDLIKVMSSGVSPGIGGTLGAPWFRSSTSMP